TDLSHRPRAPRRRPDDVHSNRVHAVDLHHGELGVGLDEVLHGAAHARQGHLDADVAGVVDLHLVHEAEVHDVHGDLRVAYDLEGFEDLLAHGRLTLGRGGVGGRCRGWLPGVAHDHDVTRGPDRRA